MLFSFHKSTGRWPCCRLEFFLSSQAWRHSENCRATETILLVSGTLCLFRSRRGRDFLGPPIFSGFSGFDCRCFASGFVHRAHFGIFCFGPISGFLHRAHFCCFGFGLAFGFLHRAHFGIFASGPRWDFCIGLTFGFLASGPFFDFCIGLAFVFFASGSLFDFSIGLTLDFWFEPIF